MSLSNIHKGRQHLIYYYINVITGLELDMRQITLINSTICVYYINCVNHNKITICREAFNDAVIRNECYLELIKLFDL